MDKITTESGTTHWLVERHYGMFAWPNDRRGRTACGLVTGGVTGATSALGIDCGRCRRSLRKEGWNV